MSNGIGTPSTIRRDLPIPVLNETITKDVSVQSRVEITFSRAYSTMCKPRPAFARTEGKYGYEYRREMARLVSALVYRSKKNPARTGAVDHVTMVFKLAYDPWKILRNPWKSSDISSFRKRHGIILYGSS